MLRGARLFALALVLSLYSSGCAPAPRDAALIHVDGVEQALDRPGELLVRGEGFPQGMRGEARLRGALYAAGRAPVAIDLDLPCRALGARAARVDLAAATASVRGEGPFEGLLELRFGTREDAQLLGRLDHVLFRLGEARAIEAQFAASQRAQGFQRALGIAALEESEEGLIVAEVSAHSPAARAGLEPGDRLLRMDGQPVQLGRDLVARDAADEIVLELRRAREGATRVVRIATGLANEVPELTLVALAALLGLFAGAALMSGLPSHVLWAPQRREYWLLLCCAVCTVSVGALVVRDVDPLLARMCAWLLGGALTAALVVCLQRRVRHTPRTSKDPDLAPLL